MNKEEFVNELSKIGIELNNNQLEQLNVYYQLLRKWNEKINLTRITEEKDVYLKHFYDSITLCRTIDLCQKMSLCDIGTGAGFPGLILKIVFPTLSVTLVDSLLKRVNFLNMVISELKLVDISVIHARGEEYAKNNSHKFDIVTSRAVANLSLLSLICLPLVKVNGYFIAMKANCEEELKDAQFILDELSSEIVLIDEFQLPIENSKRTLLKIKKKGKVDSKKLKSLFKYIKNR